MPSLLSQAQSADVDLDPFPHIIIREPLPNDVVDQLLAEYPSLETITQGLPYKNNQRFSYSANEVLGNSQISDLWREVVQAHVGTEFLQEIFQLFGQAIDTYYPWFDQRLGHRETLKAGVRNLDDFSSADVLLDAQICLNTPVTKPSSVRGPHVDHPLKLFAGLFYLKHPDDQATGGDLEIYRYRNQRNCFKMAEVADSNAMELVKTVKYERNVFIFFLNSIDSLHGVSPRSQTPLPRYLFNLVGEINQPLFDLNDYQHPAARFFLMADRLRQTDWLSMLRSPTAPKQPTSGVYRD